ncbi:DUF2997 domain-containing protein [Gordonia sp. AC31]|uniref:DUF2997 domain-containing protein n=1 Tax=Gordonia sp. AC31 TaxID=2962571 RepID=UPI0028814C80|nr:DUF2997 domain-containing protein [Gordonia sp. AC31]MDT0223759.1 DUF2997 domain-containing protein [Gordonia sp. AC31]
MTHSNRQQIVVRIAPDGTVEAETVGIVGPKCLDSVTLLEDLLDARSIASEFTKDYYRTNVHTDIEDSDELHH